MRILLRAMDMANEPDRSKGHPVQSTSERPRKAGRGVLILLLLLVVGAIAGLVIYRGSLPAGAEAKGTAGGGGRGGAAMGPVPVVAGTVAKKDVPIYLDGLVAVQAFNTVTVRS